METEELSKLFKQYADTNGLFAKPNTAMSENAFIDACRFILPKPWYTPFGSLQVNDTDSFSIKDEEGNTLLIIDDSYKSIRFMTDAYPEVLCFNKQMIGEIIKELTKLEKTL